MYIYLKPFQQTWQVDCLKNADDVNIFNHSDNFDKFNVNCFSNVDTFNVYKIHELRARLSLLQEKPAIIELSEAKAKNFRFKRSSLEYSI